MAETRNSLSVSTSRRACVEADWIYTELFRRYDPADADAGFEQAYDAGRRWLRARADAADWALPAEIADEIDALFTLVEQLPDTEVDEWLERFPRALMALLDRRLRQVELDRPGRRVADRTARPAADRSLESLVAGRRG